jgi:hypothetical protein
MTDNSHSNRRSDNARPRPNTHREAIRKVRAETVPFSESILRSGKYEWAAYDQDRLGGRGCDSIRSPAQVPCGPHC